MIKNGNDPHATDVAPELTVVVPVHNEEKSVEPLYGELAVVLRATGRSYELLFVDDGSIDGTAAALRAVQARDPHVRIVRLRRNFGQTAALAAGFDHARGQIIISLDGDMQHDPSEIPLFLEKIDQGFDVVSGWRQTRPEGMFTRRIPSRLANAAMARLSGLPIHDFGTTFKAYRSDLLKSLDLYGDFHRFIPALAADAGAKITEIPIQIRAREQGSSHYGLWRTFTVFFDLIRIRFLALYLARPLQLFGGAGLVLAGIGAAIGSYLIALRLFYHTSLLEYRWPLFTISIWSVLLGVQLFCLGLLGEIIVRLYFGLRIRRPYMIESVS